MIDHGRGCAGAPCTCRTAPEADPAPEAADDPDTVLLASLITQVLSGGALTGVTDIPAEVMVTAALIKDQGWTRRPGCRCARTESGTK